MKLLIDASNVVAGGGLTYLVELLRNAKPSRSGFGEVELWASDNTLNRVEQRLWLQKKRHSLLNGGYLDRWRWKRNVLPGAAAAADLLFIPSTGYHRCETPVVTMCRNLLPLEMEEIKKYLKGGAWMSGLRMLLLRRNHLHAFRKADGVIYLNDYSREKVRSLLAGEGRRQANTAVIPHGVNRAFLHRREDYEAGAPFELLYVSRVNFYKYQWIIAEAVARLHEEGLPLRFRLVGEPYNKSAEKLRATIQRYPVLEEIMRWEEGAEYRELPEIYRRADAYVYGSTCETFGMTLLEAMASSLPIACSEASSMKEMLRDGGIYYDPISVSSCMEAIRRLWEDRQLRRSLGERAHELASGYGWKSCARQTFDYFATVNRRYHETDRTGP